jgi:hypothetical protein
MTQGTIRLPKVGSGQANFNTRSGLTTSLLISLTLMGSVQSRDCACDCPNGCRAFNTTFGSVSDGSGSACIKESFGVTGQYGPHFYFSLQITIKILALTLDI